MGFRRCRLCEGVQLHAGWVGEFDIRLSGTVGSCYPVNTMLLLARRELGIELLP